MIKAGDTVRVIRRPHDGWTRDMPIGLEFKVTSIAKAFENAICVWNNDTYIPEGCVELVDHPWRELDRNSTHVLWECTHEGKYYQCVSTGHAPEGSMSNYREDFRIELGEVGWKLLNEGGRECGGYIPRHVPTEADKILVQFLVDAVAATPPPPPPKWPTRSDRVAILAAEMATPLSDRIKRLS